ncbi:MAG: ferrous iron transport protein B [Clostridia bacterium]
MVIKIALAGNPNCGKTTLFNDLTGSNQYVGNWPGVTVEKKEGRLKGSKEVIIQDLPGIYSLSPYTLEEVVARGYLVHEKPDAILNIVDATNLERNLYLTTQLLELGIPMVVALNMIDVTRKNGDQIDLCKLRDALGCEVVEISALKGEGSLEAAQKAAALAGKRLCTSAKQRFTDSVAHALAHIEALLKPHEGSASLSRWYAVKLFERDEQVTAQLALSSAVHAQIEELIQSCEIEMDDDAESILTSQRYAFIGKLVSACRSRGRPAGALTLSDRLDRILTNRWLALPIFAVLMFLVYYVSVTTVGDMVTRFTNDTFVGEWLQAPIMAWLTSVGTADWLVGLIGRGIIGGVGAVIGFVPQMLVLFFFLAILEDVGYMSRVAFIMDRIFRRFGLSGKSFIPMLISSGCGVPGIMASRTIENDRDRKMTLITTTFIPCSAKMPIVGLIAGALFHNAGWVAFSAYLIGVAAVVLSGIMLKKTKLFAGEPSPFVMELPDYHAPSGKNVLHSMWERGSGFIKRAGTVVVLASILIWFTSGYGFAPAKTTPPDAADERASFVFGAVENMDESILGKVGGAAAPMFQPLGFGSWQATVATVMGLVAKEEVVGVFGVLYGVDGNGMSAEDLLASADVSNDEKAGALSPILRAFHESSQGHAQLAAFCFLLFNLLCAPCFAAMGAIRREMNNGKWTAFAIGYQCAFAYSIGLIVYQLGLLFAGESFTVVTAIAFLLLAGMGYLLVRKKEVA